ncbi:LacI family transcriptional regulator [bacterium]|nr:MAG: LacI family transcriptional regulator [bacterium]
MDHTSRPGNHEISSRPEGRVTAKMVADRAGASITTVSRVLNSVPVAVSESLRQRILEAAKELDYSPNALAVSLRKGGATKTIGLLIADISAPYFHVLTRGVEDAAQAAGYTVILCDTDRNPQKELKYLDVLYRKQVDAIIFAGGAVDEDQHLHGRKWGPIKVVTVGPHTLPFPRVEVDDRAATAAAVAHLVEQGCRRIACISGQRNWLISKRRGEGYEQGLIAAGLTVDERLYWASTLTLETGEACTKRALDAGLSFDGLVAFTDEGAIGAMRALKAAGLRIPEDVAVIGCDDTRIAPLTDPPLSSIAFPLHQMGVVAVEIILAMRAGLAIEDRHFPFELRLRTSSLRRPRGG